MNSPEEYPGQNILISYLKKQNKPSFYKFLTSHHDIILTSITPSNLKDLDNLWFSRFLLEIKDFPDLKTKNPMDIFTISSKLDNDEYTNIEEFEKDMHLIFYNCYIYNDKDSKIYHLGKELESDFIEIWAKKTQKKVLTRTQDISTNKTKVLTEKNKKQNKDDLVFNDVINNALYATLAYKNLVNIIPFINILKTSLLSRSQMSLSSMNEPVLQAIVEGFLSRKYQIPELSLVMDVWNSLVGLIKKQKDEYSTNDLEDLDKTLEKENEELLLNRPYLFWSKEHNKMNQIIVSETLEKGINQLRSYMNVIAKGKPTDYFSSGICDKRVKITKSNPNELKGFVILVIGFRRILWRPVEEVMSNYSYDKV
ncbi:hypothetical protein GLOIN_2v1771827 [Rhizophagus clarus]|uniref:Bromo domain-containing protein n=1 Tax=Rhizophagus clarus TaxID=94130 RepID=A0A8H3QWQ6_9GLOM|nr:hypothetical protein GLOIN_2v1771827 [Rhizophagus clarus]